jgi:hypothetical protein
MASHPAVIYLGALSKNPEISVSEFVEPVLTKAQREIKIDKT